MVHHPLSLLAGPTYHSAQGGIEYERLYITTDSSSTRDPGGSYAVLTYRRNVFTTIITVGVGTPY